MNPNTFQTPDYVYESTQKLVNRAYGLVNSGFKCVSAGPKKNITATGSGNKCDQAARKRIQDEWDALKNTTIRWETSDRSIILPQTDDSDEILHGVVAYIEINNQEKAVTLRRMLIKMGASVSSRFSNEVTHIIFRHGNLETYKKAKLLNVYLVSILWIEACRNSKKHISEKMYPVVIDSNDYLDSPRRFEEFVERHCDESIEDYLQSLEGDTGQTGVTSIIVHHSDTNNSNETVHLRVSSDTSGERSKENCVVEQTLTESESVLKPIENQSNVNLTKAPDSAAKRKLFTANPSREIYLDTIRESENPENTPPPCVAVNPYKQPGEFKRTKRKNNNISGIKILKTPTPTKSKIRMAAHLLPSNRKTQSLVTSSLHTQENAEVKKIIDELGGFSFKAYVRSDTTHLVVGGPRRTVNILKAIARGCWVLRKDWLQDSYSAGYWLDEQSYELTEFSDAVQKCRIERQTFGRDYQLDIFKECGRIFVDADCTAPQVKDLKELVSLCGGKMAPTARSADIVIGKRITGSMKCATEKWILDSITIGRCKKIKKYFIPIF